MPPEARAGIAADPYGTLLALNPILPRGNTLPIRTLFVHNKTANGVVLIVGLSRNAETHDRWSLLPGQWKRLTEKETSRYDNAAGLWCITNFFVGGTVPGVITAYDYEVTLWDKPDQLEKARGRQY